VTSGRRALLWVVLVGLAVVFAAPIIAMIVLSLQADESVVAVDQGSIRAFIPRSISLQNYQDALNRRGAARSLVNTGLITFVTVGAGLVVNSMCAFALARLRWPGRRAVLAGVVALMIVPFQTLAVPLLLIVNRFGWLDTYHVQIIPFVANPFYIFLFYLSFAELSSEIEEAAILDGAGRWTIYRRMVVPLSRPIFATVAVLHGLAIWGSFLWPLMVTRGPDVRPVTVAMQVFAGGSPAGDTFAFANMITLPVLILFLIFQRGFIGSVAGRQISAG